VVFEVRAPFDADSLHSISGVSRVEQIGDRVVIYGQKNGLVSKVIKTLETSEIQFDNLRTERPNLEDVFLSLTGKEMRN
jgi:hypothetical protein